MKNNILLFIIVLIAFPLLSIEVGGHITENTLWYPHHNDPYIVTSFLYIDSGVTLTIMPGTEILVYGGLISASHHFEWGGLNNDNEPVAKMIIVNGAINAVGSPEDPIIFDKYQDNSEYRWGGIALTPDAPISSFEYCEIRHTYIGNYVPNEVPNYIYGGHRGAINFLNGLINVKNCTFENNCVGLRTTNLNMDLVVYKCRFITTNIYPLPHGNPTPLSIRPSEENPPNEAYNLVIARCYFNGPSDYPSSGGYLITLFLFNTYYNFGSEVNATKTREINFGRISSYGNYAYNGRRGWGCHSGDSTEVVFARKNTLVKNVVDLDPINLYSGGFGTNYLSDNYLFGNVQVTAETRDNNKAYIYNNIIETNEHVSSVMDLRKRSLLAPDGQIRVFNNLVRQTADTPAGLLFYTYDTSPYIYNNTFVNNSWLITARGSSAAVLENNIIDISTWYGTPSTGYITSLINNCSILPFPQGTAFNVENHLYADPLFADTLNHNYSLSPSSPCRDAGAYRPDLPDFDLRYHKRIASANGSNPDIVDIGAYEYGSVYIGGFSGNVYDASTNQPLDCVRIEIIDKLPEFSDSLGNYTYHCGAGTYTVKASRWDYQDVIISDVMIMESLELNLDIPMLPIGVSNQDDDVIPVSESAFGLRNYPNPFNPETKISFILPKKAYGHLAVYNLKGQKVASLYQGLLNSGYHSYVWDGKNSQSASVSSGIYFVKLEVEGKSQTHKIVLMK